MYQQRASINGTKKQWDGWDTEMKEWLFRENFRKVWNNHNRYYDTDFAEYLNKYLSENSN